MSRAIVSAAVRIANALFSEAWEYRVRTSKPSDAPAYGAWTEIQAHQTERTYQREYDQDRDTVVKRDMCLVRVDDQTPLLTLGDQLRDADSVLWSIDAVSSSGPGTRQYRLERVAAIQSQADTGGTV